MLLTAIGWIPLALLGVWSIHAASQYQQREQERAILDVARALSSAADAELDGSVATLASMSRAPEMMAGNVRAFYDIAREQARAQPEWLGVVLTDAEGNILFKTTAEYGAPPGEVVDPASLKRVLAVRRPVVGHITRGKGGRPAIPVRIPVADRNGRLYTLTAAIRPDRIVRVIERQRIPGDSVISVMDAYGAIVARSRDQEKTVTLRPSPSLTQLIKSGGAENVGRTKTIEGGDVVTAYTTLSRYGWTVAVGVPIAALRSDFLRRFALYGAGIAGSLAASIVLSSILSSRIARTIAALQAGAASLGTGEPVAAVPTRIKEIRAMGEALQAASRQRVAHEQERSLLLASLKDALDSQRKALAQARSAGRAKDEFLAVLGHELRNPLSPIVTSLDLMDMRDDPASKRERAVMRRQVQHLRRLVDDLLDVSRITSGKLQLDLKPLNLADVVRQAAGAVPGQGITVSAPELVWVQGDDNRLVQVLNNLLSNAVRFGSDSTKVTLTAGGGAARLTVRDNGIGMPQELLAHAFEPFYQAPQQLARRTGGLGLGLAIVRRIVELHGGQVVARSAGPGKGSEFEVTLPLANAALPEPERIEPAPQGRTRVLLVDDNEDAADAGALLLSQIGHDVRVAHTATAALAVFPHYAPAVAILDIGLPDMDGYALAAALRKQQGGAPLRLVALTGYGQKTDIDRAGQAGFDLHLTKPATADDFRRAVADAASEELLGSDKG
jgi:signal transduction histidine kinase/ActR/RegA family two-component response regulator